MKSNNTLINTIVLKRIWLGTMLILLFLFLSGCMTTNRKSVVNIEDSMYHFTLQSSGASEENFNADQQIILGRIDSLAKNLDYQWRLNGEHSLEFYIPKECLGTVPLENVLQQYIVEETKFYLADSDNVVNMIPVNREDLEMAVLCTGIIPNTDMKQYGITDDTYPYITIVLTDDFVKKYKTVYEKWTGVVFVQDIGYRGEEWHTGYTYHTYSYGDGKNYCIFDDYANEKVISILEYSLKEPCLSEALEYIIDINSLVQWENPKEQKQNAGKYQCAFSDFTEGTETFILNSKGYETITEGSFQDIRDILISRLDTLREPYAFGWTYDNMGDIFAIKTTVNHINEDILHLVGKKSVIRVGTRSCQNRFIDDNCVWKRNDGRMIFDVNPFSSENIRIYEKIKKIAEIEKTPVYIYYDDYPIFQFDPEEMTSDNLVEMDFCHIKGGKIHKIDINEDTIWYCDFISTVFETSKRMNRINDYDYIKTQFNPGNNGECPDIHDTAPLLHTQEDEIDSAIKSLYPYTKTSYYLGKMEIDMDIACDAQFPYEVAEFVKKIISLAEKEYYYIKQIQLEFYDCNLQEPSTGLMWLDKRISYNLINNTAEEIAEKGRRYGIDIFLTMLDDNWELYEESILKLLTTPK